MSPVALPRLECMVWIHRELERGVMGQSAVSEVWWGHSLTAEGNNSGDQEDKARKARILARVRNQEQAVRKPRSVRDQHISHHPG